MVEADAVPVSADWHVRAAAGADATAWAALREALWPDEDPARHAGDIRHVLARPGRAAGFLAVDENGIVLGFAESTLRSDYVNGTDSSPVGFLEGWYVLPACRGSGIGRALVQAVERWTRAQGCSELASDTWLHNEAGQRAHLACGFQEADKVVYFVKRVLD